MAHQGQFSVERMCKALGVSRSGYYGWCKTRNSARKRDREVLQQAVREVHGQSKGIYGSPRVVEQLRDRGHKVSRATVGRIMRQMNLRSKVVRKFRVLTTQSKHHLPVAPNILDRSFKVERLGQVWVSDLTYIPIGSKWCYLTVIIDLADRKVIGWSLSKSMMASQTVLPAWKRAIWKRRLASDGLFHSDQGVQFACQDFRDQLAKAGPVVQSMSRKGNCWDNAVAESFFKSLKTELVYHHNYQTYEEAERSVFEYIEGWYNTRRKHSSLGYKTPAQMEKHLLTKVT